MFRMNTYAKQGGIPCHTHIHDTWTTNLAGRSRPIQLSQLTFTRDCQRHVDVGARRISEQSLSYCSNLTRSRLPESPIVLSTTVPLTLAVLKPILTEYGTGAPISPSESLAKG